MPYNLETVGVGSVYAVSQAVRAANTRRYRFQVRARPSYEHGNDSLFAVFRQLSRSANGFFISLII